MSSANNHLKNDSQKNSSPEDAPPKTGLAGFFERLQRRLRPGGAFHRDDLVEGLADDDNAHADSFDDDERRFLKNVLALSSCHVEDVMVRRAQIMAISADASFEDVCAAFRETNHSRLPVYSETLDKPIGIVHIKDAFRLLAQKPAGNFNLETIVNLALFVPPSMKAVDLLRKMQAERLHMALVIDEHGGTSGLVSIEDLVEEIVGEIEDEHEKESQSARGYVRRSDGTIEAPAHLRLGALKEVLGQDLRASENINADTLGGLVTKLAGHVPRKGERVTTSSGLVIEIRRADQRRVRTVRLHPSQKDKQRLAAAQKSVSGTPAAPAQTSASQAAASQADASQAGAGDPSGLKIKSQKN